MRVSCWCVRTLYRIEIVRSTCGLSGFLSFVSVDAFPEEFSASSRRTPNCTRASKNGKRRRRRQSPPLLLLSRLLHLPGGTPGLLLALFLERLRFLLPLLQFPLLKGVSFSPLVPRRHSEEALLLLSLAFERLRQSEQRGALQPRELRKERIRIDGRTTCSTKR